MRLLRHLSLPPGRYQVRVAAQDSGKVKQGSAHFDLDVPDFTRNPIALSSIALAATADRSVYSPPKPGFDPFNGLLPGPPSALREFPVNSEISAAVEVYDNKPTPAHGIDVTARVKADDGRIVFNKHEERSSEELHGTPGWVRLYLPHPDAGVDAGSVRAGSRSEDTAQRRRAGYPRHSVRGEVDEKVGTLRRSLSVALYVFVAAIMSAQTPSFTSVAKGDMSGQQIARQVTVRTAAEWKALWKDHAPTEKMPDVDFDKNMVVGIFLGSKPSAGHDVEIVGVRTQEKDLIVEYVQKQPGRGTMAAQILTEPYHLVSVPNTRARFDSSTCPTLASSW